MQRDNKTMNNEDGSREATRTFNVVLIQVSGGLVEGENATVEAEGLCKRKADE